MRLTWSWKAENPRNGSSLAIVVMEVSPFDLVVM
jgi:hypothetical protein